MLWKASFFQVLWWWYDIYLPWLQRENVHIYFALIQLVCSLKYLRDFILTFIYISQHDIVNHFHSIGAIHAANCLSMHIHQNKREILYKEELTNPKTLWYILCKKYPPPPILFTYFSYSKAIPKFTCTFCSQSAQKSFLSHTFVNTCEGTLLLQRSLDPL